MQTQKFAAIQAATLDRETWISAGRLLQVYGPQALSRAAKEVEYCSSHGDAAAEIAWKRVTSAIVLLTSTEGQLPN
jgi:hypothetical protein